MTIRVIGAGFGRTGTLSLKVALETLGFNKCYHMKEVDMNPAHIKLWHTISLGKSVNWNELFQGYQATVDWPSCAFYLELVQQYPEAKVLLTIRDPDSWYQSVLMTIFRSGRGFLPRLTRLFSPLARLDQAMVNNIIWEGTFQGKFGDKAYAINIFQKHIEAVQEIVPPERLLVYEVKQGWEPLCRFLEVAVPDGIPFPHLNSTDEFRSTTRWISKIFKNPTFH